MANAINDSIQNKVDMFDYSDSVNKKVEELKKELKPNKKIHLHVKTSSRISAPNIQSVIDQYSQQLIQYRIKEKACVKLMLDGLIYPVHSCEGNISISTDYYTPTTQSLMNSMNFSRLIFDEFLTM